MFDPRNILLIAGLLLIVVSLMISLRKKRERAAHQPTVDEEIAFRRQARGLRGDLDDLMVEIEQLAKRLGTQLDAKAMHLEMLLREADQRLEALKRLTTPAPGSSPAPGSAPGSSPGNSPGKASANPGESSSRAPAGHEGADTTAPAPADADLSGAGRSPGMAGHASADPPGGTSGGSDASGGGGTSGGGGGGTAAAQDMTRRVYDLADQGLAPADIARRLDEHVGKVELILALRQQ